VVEAMLVVEERRSEEGREKDSFVTLIYCLLSQIPTIQVPTATFEMMTVERSIVLSFA